MTCAEWLSMADPYLAGELPVDASEELRAHLDGCPACRAELSARRALRQQLRRAVFDNPELAPEPAFLAEVRSRLSRTEASDAPRRRFLSLSLAAAAAVLAAAGGGAIWWYSTDERGPGWARLAAEAAGDHQDCALQHALDEAPISLDEAARLYDRVYGGMQEAVEASTAVRAGDVEIVGAHACVFHGRRFAHVIVRRRGQLVSVLVTDASDAPPAGARSEATACGPANGFEVTCSGAGRYAIFVVSDLTPAEHLPLARALTSAMHGYLAPATTSARPAAGTPRAVR